ncbi:protein phosphatase regulator [Purpureocillium lilacinum]|uniref:Protein phosphatase regulator n=1 Tax=Purpureocillium lilacinum TaxID=33203 RepID=A0A179H8P0_PURLI|nr:protein phosphatase regulator [Purpureocillium lilacinum]OAQ86000.1 protein phosphatase regulator [Purpureocillium lilacinum]OAQ93960.1 protein phosphatase regulator [Purpureocillium lilacinum]
MKGVVNGGLGGSVRQSPPPPTDARELIPKGAIVSPPESATSGSDDEEPIEILGRDRDTLKNLRDAVSQIPLPATSPAPSNDGKQETEAAESHGVRLCLSTSALANLPKVGRKLGHVRSATESTITTPKSADNSVMGSEEDSDEDLKYKPQMVRKKSGELVRPALRASHRRPTSMPGTPIFSKAVHFDSHLEHVRHFLQVDRPLAVSAGSSPVENYESDGEYPFPGNGKQGTRTPPFEWELVTANFPHDSHHRKAMPVRLEKVWLSSDQKSLLGSIAVANLAFHKQVSCRFTLDYWKTVSEVAAEYSHEIRPRETPVSYDRFTFTIKLSDMANLESKTLFFCVRYSVNGQEFWDNNSSTNFQVDFKKKHLPQNGKNNFGGATSRSANGLPRSSNRRHNPPSALRPVSVPVSLDAFGSEPNKLAFDQPIHEYLGESGPLRLKTKSTANLASDNIATNLTSPSGVAFSNRYDFGASLSAAMQVAKDAAAKDKDALYMKRNVRGFGSSLGVPQPAVAAASPSSSSEHSPNGSLSPTPSLASASYEELVNKYCFFGSSKSSPTIKDGTLKNGSYDGPAGDIEAKSTLEPVLSFPDDGIGTCADGDAKFGQFWAKRTSLYVCDEEFHPGHAFCAGLWSWDARERRVLSQYTVVGSFPLEYGISVRDGDSRLEAQRTIDQASDRFVSRATMNSDF